MPLVTYSPYKRDLGTFFNTSTSFISDQTNTQILSSPGSGKSWYITDMIVSAGTAGSITFSTAPLGTSVDIMNTIAIPANNVKAINFMTPLKVTASSTLRITTVSLGLHSIILSGYKNA